MRVAAFADVLTMIVDDDDDDDDEAMRERRTAAPTCTTRTANLVKAARRQSAFTWVFRMPHSKACVYKRPLTM